MSFRKRRRLCDRVSAVVLSGWQRMREAMRIDADIQQDELPLHGLGSSAERHGDDGRSSCYKGSLR
jgi:hypothetical protein